MCNVYIFLAFKFVNFMLLHYHLAQISLYSTNCDMGGMRSYAKNYVKDLGGLRARVIQGSMACIYINQQK